MSNSIEALSGSDPTVLPFAVKDHWTVTVESERRLVKLRHRTRWYAVARRKGHEDRSYCRPMLARATGHGRHYTTSPGRPPFPMPSNQPAPLIMAMRGQPSFAA